jgi:hypothetical protein
VEVVSGAESSGVASLLWGRPGPSSSGELSALKKWLVDDAADLGGIGVLLE